MDYDVYLELAEDLPALERTRTRIDARPATVRTRGDRALAEELAAITRDIDTPAGWVRLTA